MNETKTRKYGVSMILVGIAVTMLTKMPWVIAVGIGVFITGIMVVLQTYGEK